jgi:cytochrome P450
MSKLTGLQKLKESTEFQNQFIQSIVDDHYKKFNSASIEDYTDAMLAEREERKSKNMSVDIFDDETIISELRVLYSAGTDTTAMVMRWILVYLIAHPDAQRKVQREIDDVIGQNRTPNMDDRKNMPYTEAFLMEVMRKRPTTFLIDAHKTLEDVRLGGYFIPKGTAVYGNSFAIHNDRELWGDPNSFRPERFINEDGQLVKPEYLIPFSVGKRNCIGESLARMLLFLSVTSLLQKYTLLPPDGQQIDTVGCIAFSHVDLCDKMRAVFRDDSVKKTVSTGL